MKYILLYLTQILLIQAENIENQKPTNQESEKEKIKKLSKQIYLIIQETSRLTKEINTKLDQTKKQDNETINYKKQNEKLKKEILYYQKSIIEIRERIKERLNARLLYKESRQCNKIKEELEQLEKELKITFISKSE